MSPRFTFIDDPSDQARFHPLRTTTPILRSLVSDVRVRDGLLFHLIVSTLIAFTNRFSCDWCDGAFTRSPAFLPANFLPGKTDSEWNEIPYSIIHAFTKGSPPSVPFAESVPL